MPLVEVSLPKQTDVEIDRVAEHDEFVDREQAIEALLAMGLSVHLPADEPPSKMADDVFTQTVEDQHDPAAEPDR